VHSVTNPDDTAARPQRCSPGASSTAHPLPASRGGAPNRTASAADWQTARHCPPLAAEKGKVGRGIGAGTPPPPSHVHPKRHLPRRPFSTPQGLDGIAERARRVRRKRDIWVWGRGAEGGRLDPRSSGVSSPSTRQNRAVQSREEPLRPVGTRRARPGDFGVDSAPGDKEEVRGGRQQRNEANKPKRKRRVGQVGEPAGAVAGCDALAVGAVGVPLARHGAAADGVQGGGVRSPRYG